MPIVRYFVVVGPILLGLLLLADAKLPPPGPITNSTNFYGLYPGVPTQKAAHLTVVSAPEPDMNSPAVLAAAPRPDPATTGAVAKPAKSDVKHEAPKKSKKVARKRNWRDDYALANPWHDRIW